MEVCAYVVFLFANSRSKATAGVLVNAPLIKFYEAKELLQKHSTEITKVQWLICIILLP